MNILHFVAVMVYYPLSTGTNPLVCTTSVQCPAGSSCKDGTCTPFTGVYRNSCKKPADCPLEYECDVNINMCVIESCIQDEDCPNLGPGSYAICNAGQCAVGNVQNASRDRSELLQVIFEHIVIVFHCKFSGSASFALPLSIFRPPPLALD